MHGGRWQGKRRHRALGVIGGIEDYHFELLDRAVRPIMLTRGSYYGTLVIKTGADHTGTISRLKEVAVRKI